MIIALERYDGHSAQRQNDLVEAMEVLGFRLAGCSGYDVSKGHRLVFVAEEGIPETGNWMFRDESDLINLGDNLSFDDDGMLFVDDEA